MMEHETCADVQEKNVATKCRTGGRVGATRMRKGITMQEVLSTNKLREMQRADVGSGVRDAMGERRGG